MFAHNYFSSAYFRPEYFAPVAVTTPIAVTPGGYARFFVPGEIDYDDEEGLILMFIAAHQERIQ